MKLTIDTKEDSHEDIKKVIKMLQSLIGEHALANQPLQDSYEPPKESSTAFFNMFGDSSSAPSVNSSDSDPSSQEDASHEDNSTELEDIVPDIIPY